jgi:leader peptidase (prepilin peptidase) / N-methyltransferase
MIMIATFAGVFGAVVGSFLNVVVYRVPRGLSVVRPASACPNCGHAIRGVDNIPILSWLLLRGRCRDCAAPISARYPLVEAATALAFVPVAIRFPVSPVDGLLLALSSLAVLIGYLWLAGASVALTLIDLETRKLPNRIVAPAFGVLGGLLVVAALLSGDFAPLWSAVIGSGAMFAGYLLLALLSRGGMGMGDVKLAAVLGLALGWLGFPTLVVGALAAFLLGGVFSLVLLATRRARRGAGIPFGPWMIAGAWLGVFWGDGIGNAYLALVGIA